MDEGRRQGAAADVAQVRAALDSEPEVIDGAQALASFSSMPAGLLEVVRLRSPVDPQVVVDTIPWLEPLASTISDGDWGVAVASRRSARLFRGDASRLIEFASFEDPLHRRHQAGGWSQANFRRAIDRQAAVHARHIATRMFRAHRRRPFAHLVIVAADELWPLIEHALSPELRAVLAGSVAEDFEHAPTDEIRRAVRRVIEKTERERERALLARVEERLACGGRAAGGRADVLAALEQKRVETLLVGADDTENRAIADAEHQSATVVAVRHETEWLRRRGGIAATLRW